MGCCDVGARDRWDAATWAQGIDGMLRRGRNRPKGSILNLMGRFCDWPDPGYNFRFQGGDSLR